MTAIRRYSRLEASKPPIARRLLVSLMKTAVAAMVSSLLRRPKIQQRVSRSEAAAEVTAKQHVHATSRIFMGTAKKSRYLGRTSAS